MSINLSLADVFAEAFGYETKAFEPKFADVRQRRFDNQNGSRYYSPASEGLEYYLPVKISYPDNTKLSPSDAALAQTDTLGLIKTWYLPHPVISVTGRKTIVETPLTERRGTVKEVINMQDYEITIKGLIIGANNEYPEEDVMKLRDIFELNVAVTIENPITDIFLMGPGTSGSDKVVIKELSFPEVKAVKNVRPYQITMVSDAPFNMIDLK